MSTRRTNAAVSMSKRPEPRVNRRIALRLAVEADIDPRSAIKALRYGPSVLRGRPGERAAEAMARMGLRPVVVVATGAAANAERAA